MQQDSSRPRRIGHLLQRELADLIRREVKDPRVHDVTLTGVDMSRDLASAKVFFTCLDPKADVKALEKALNGVAGFLRHALRDRVDLRGIPKLRFVHDASTERGARINELLARTRGASGDTDENE
jgi:ribosome-binding factor A